MEILPSLIWRWSGIWSNATRVAARKLMAALSSGGQGEEPAYKRARLESIIPAPVAAGKKETAKNQQSTPPPKPCPPPLWLSGQLPAAHCGRGNRRGSGSPHRGGQPTRGGQPGPHGGSRGSRVPYKGGYPLGPLVRGAHRN